MLGERDSGEMAWAVDLSEMPFDSELRPVRLEIRISPNGRRFLLTSYWKQGAQMTRKFCEGKERVSR